MYNLGPNEFIGWYGQERRPGLNKGNRERLARRPGGSRARVRVHQCAHHGCPEASRRDADNGPPEQMFFYGQTDSGYGRGRQLSMDGTSRVIGDIHDKGL